MASGSRDLLELCREHGLVHGWIEGCGDPEVLLDHALEQCARVAADHGRLSEASLLELRGLALVALHARGMQKGGAGDSGHRVGSRIEVVCESGGEFEGRSEWIRVERVGEFAGELAVLCHKINNPLTSLLGRAQMLRLKVKAETDSPLGKEAQVIEESAKRVAAVVQELAQLVGQVRVEILEPGRPR